jgi:tetratricopeptide (TPR) repeat protein
MQTLHHAITAFRSGQFDAARRACRVALREHPGHIEALHLLGLICLQTREPRKAIEHLERASRLRPKDAALLLNLGAAFKATEQLEYAARCFRDAAALAPSLGAAHYNLGNTLALLKQHEAAMTAFRAVLNLDPSDISALNSLGSQYLALERPQQAIETFEKALALAPDFTIARLNLGFAFLATAQYEKALETLEAVCKTHPGIDSAFVGKGNALNGLAQHAEALIQYEQAIALNPRHADAWVRAGCTYLELARHADALRAFEQALSIDSTLASAHLYRGMVLLTLGDFEQGFREYEWREAVIARPRPADLPRWDNSQDENVTLLIYAEQGFGDTLQFVRFVPLASKLVGHVVLEVQPALIPLLEPAATAWGVTLISNGEDRPAVDCCIPLLSLPYVLGLHSHTIPHAHYLRTPDRYREKWAHLSSSTTKRRIGLAWSGRIRPYENRAIPLAALIPLFELENIEWYMLQREIGDHDRTTLEMHPVASRIHRLDDRSVGDFADTAAIIEQMDAIVSIDTAICHLAGALGKPLWIMLALGADWRWFAGTDSSPWYPSATLVRQQRAGAWDTVVSSLKKALQT